MLRRPYFAGGGGQPKDRRSGALDIPGAVGQPGAEKEERWALACVGFGFF